MKPFSFCVFYIAVTLLVLLGYKVLKKQLENYVILTSKNKRQQSESL